MTQDVCYWSVGDGDYAFMLQSLVDSFHRAGMEGDFHVFSDRKIEGAITHRVKEFEKKGFLFKFAFLMEEMVSLDYRHFVFLDADTYIVRKPSPLLDLMKGSPLHFFFESVCNAPTKRQDWWNCPLDKYVQMMRDCGVTHEKIYNLNSGLFILRKDIINIACSLALDFWQYALRLGYFFPDEPPWAYAMHMLCDEPEKHLLRDHFDVWCSDWAGELSKSLPNGQPWTFRDYFTYEPFTVNPAIVHAIKSKPILCAHGKELVARQRKK